MADDILNAFSDLFGDFFGAKRSGPPRGRDLRVELELDLPDIDSGCVREIEVRRGKLCRTCTGTGFEASAIVKDCAACKGSGGTKRAQGFFEITEACAVCRGRGRIGTACDGCMGVGTQPVTEKLAITVPAGVGDGVTLRLKDKGDEIRDGALGHLYVALKTRPHARLTRRDADLLVEVVVPHDLAATGGSLAVPDLHGERTVVIPASTKDRDELVVPNAGMQIFNAPRTPMPTDAPPGDTPYRELALGGRGNLVVTLRVQAKGFFKRLFKTDRP